MNKSDKISTTIFYFSIFAFIIGFNFQDNPPGGWYQQFLPDLNSQPLSDVTFLDSLTGFAITGDQTPNDTNYILKTTNGGDNWNIIYQNYRNFLSIQFLDLNTGYVCGGFNTISGTLLKTTDGGNNWINLNTPGSIWYDDMHVQSEDTIWLAQRSSSDGGVFRTTNGGINWTQQLNLGGQNPSRIYMFDEDLGFITNNSGTYLRRTTNSGENWNVVQGQIGFTDVKFINSNTGWKCGENDSIKKTIDGGANWFKQSLPPSGGFFNLSRIERMSLLNKDTIWGAGPRGFTSLGFRGLIYISTNGGENWGYQLPDTNIVTIGRYSFVQFINKNTGWVYGITAGVHTITGGDTTIYLGVHQIGNEIPISHKLYQNYPNPFNPKTTIKYEVQTNSDIRLSVYDITGKNIIDLVKENQSPGTYSVDFPGGLFSSGIYFYSLYSDGKLIATRKMMLVK